MHTFVQTDSDSGKVLHFLDPRIIQRVPDGEKSDDNVPSAASNTREKAARKEEVAA